MNTTETVRLLFFPRESYPTTRVRLNVLFGRELLSRGHKVDFVMQAANEAIAVGTHTWSGNFVHVGCTDDQDEFIHRFRKHWLSLRHDLAWLWRAKAGQYDAILVSDKFLIAVVASFVARKRGAKFFFWMTFPLHKSSVLLGRAGIARYPLISMVRGYVSEFALKRIILSRSDHVFVQSQRMMKDFVALGVNPGKLTPIVTGIDLNEIVPTYGHNARESRQFRTVAYLGTLASERHLEVLVDTLSELGRRGTIAKLLLVGDSDDPEDRNRLRQRAQQLGLLDQIEITGYLPRAEALERIRTADICVSPIFPSPLFDGASPTKLVEYLALGIPVVANRHPDQDLVLHESRAGISVPWGARHFARAIHWLLRRSDAERSAMGMRGRAWVEAHRSYSGIADAFERACLQSLCNSSDAE